MHTGPISFPNWKQTLEESDLNQDRQRVFGREIISFLRHCKVKHAPASVELIKQWLALKEKQADGPAHLALRWFYREGTKSGEKTKSRTTRPSPEFENEKALSQATPQQEGSSGPRSLYALSQGEGEGTTPTSSTAGRMVQRRMEPPPAASDKGNEPWEQALIKASRERGFLWRTEQTYREWAARFARFLAPRSPYAAGGDEVAAFLSALAVEGRASAPAQKQALNALVFLMQ